RKRPPFGGLWKFDVAILAREQAFALEALALQFAIAADGFGAFAGAFFAGFLVVAAELSFAKDGFTLHLLVQRLERLVDIVVANDDLQVRLLWAKNGRKSR